MSGGFPQEIGICNPSSSVSGPSSRGTSVTAAAKAYSGSFTTLIASTPNDACWMEVTFWPTGNSSNRCFAQIAVGAAASEQVVINDLMATSTTGGSNSTTYSFPINIPAGTRLSARCNNTSNDANNIAIRLFDAGFNPIEGSGVDSIGFVSGNPSGTNIDPGAVASTKGAYVQLTSVTLKDYSGIMICYGQNSTDNAAISPPGFLDVAIGSPGSEIIIYPDYPTSVGANGLSSNICQYIPISIPAGTAISVRSAQASITAGARVIGCVVYGIYK